MTVGPMFSAKTSALQAEAKRAIVAGKHILYLIPAIDTRYDTAAEMPMNRSHDGTGIRASRIHGSLEHVDADDNVDAIFIDEGQFVHGIEPYALRQRARGKHVYIACLRTDFRGEPWPNTSNLIASHADRVEFLTAVCIVCSSTDALYTRLKGTTQGGSDTTIIGGDETYASVCSAHFREPAVLDDQLIAKRANAVAKLRQVTQ